MQTKRVISEYDQQAIDFLESTGTTLTVTFLYTGEYFPSEKDKRDIYQFTLTNDKGSYSAKFGDSLNNTQFNAYATRSKPLDYKSDWNFCKANKIHVSASGYIRPQKRRTPSAYDILACLDAYCPDSFEDFCEEYGYNELPLSEHDNTMRTYLNVKEQAAGLNKLFDADQLEQLTEIS